MGIIAAFDVLMYGCRVLLARDAELNRIVLQREPALIRDDVVAAIVAHRGEQRHGADDVGAVVVRVVDVLVFARRRGCRQDLLKSAPLRCLIDLHEGVGLTRGRVRRGLQVHGVDVQHQRLAGYLELRTDAHDRAVAAEIFVAVSELEIVPRAVERRDLHDLLL